MSKKLVLFGLFAILATVAVNINAQQRETSIRGRVMDVSGKPMKGFQILARSAVSGREHTATTNENGEFVLGALEPGEYLLQDASNRTAGGSSQTTVTVDTNSGRTLSLQADNTGQVQYQAETVIASKETAAIKNEFAEPPVESLPQPNALGKSGDDIHGPYNLSLLTEGVTPGSILQTGIGPSVGGRPNTSNNFEVHGMDNNNQAVPGPLVDISNEAVSDFTITQAEPLSLMGHSSGGQLNVFLTPGTNLWHGGIYEYLNTRKLNAVEPALAGRLRTQRYDQSRMGVKAGGPLITNKLFAFLDFEYLPLRSDRIQLMPVLAPTADGYTTLASITGISGTNLASLRANAGEAPNATTVTSVGGLSIPLGPLNTDLRTSTDQFRGVINIDWHLGSTSKLAARYGHSDVGTNAFGSTLPAFAVPGHTRSLFGALDYTTVLGSGMTVNGNAGYNRYDQSVGGGSLTFPGLASSFPNINVEELGLTLGSTLAARRIRTNLYQLGGWADWAVNRHHIRVGVDSRFLQSTFGDFSTLSGNFAYTSLERFLRDLPPDAGAQQSFGTNAFAGDRSVWSLFVQDRMRARGMDVEFGIAYQYSQLPLSVRRQGALSALNVPGLISFDQPKPDRNNFAPHVGIAWSPGSRANDDKKWVRTALRHAQ